MSKMTEDESEEERYQANNDDCPMEIVKHKEWTYVQDDRRRIGRRALSSQQ